LKPSLLVLDVDGVLTDGGIYVDTEGRETVRFNVYDGYGIRSWLEAGGECIWITGRMNPSVSARASKLGITNVFMGVTDKTAVLSEYLQNRDLGWDDVVYIGDDIVDIDPMKRAAFGIAVASAISEVKDVADSITERTGGHGAVREVIDGFLHAAGKSQKHS